MQIRRDKRMARDMVPGAVAARLRHAFLGDGNCGTWPTASLLDGFKQPFEIATAVPYHSHRSLLGRSP